MSQRIVTANLAPPACPGCNTELTAHAGDGVPADGDVSICAYCMTASIFELDQNGYKLRKPRTKAERKACAEAIEEVFG